MAIVVVVSEPEYYWHALLAVKYRDTESKEAQIRYRINTRLNAGCFIYKFCWDRIIRYVPGTTLRLVEGSFIYASKAIETFHGLHECCIGGKDNKFAWCAYHSRIKCPTKFSVKDTLIVIIEFRVQMGASNGSLTELLSQSDTHGNWQRYGKQFLTKFRQTLWSWYCMSFDLYCWTLMICQARDKIFYNNFSNCHFFENNQATIWKFYTETKIYHVLKNVVHQKFE